MKNEAPAVPRLKPDDLLQSKILQCPDCGNGTFEEVVIIRIISKLISGQPDDMPLPLPIFVCCACGKPCPEAQRPELRQLLGMSSIQLTP